LIKGWGIAIDDSNCAGSGSSEIEERCIDSNLKSSYSLGILAKVAV
jgi:hypothetical protein